jgi:hypothetical protein
LPKSLPQPEEGFFLFIKLVPEKGEDYLARLSHVTKEAFVTHKLGLLPPEKIKKAGEIFSCLFKLCVF